MMELVPATGWVDVARIHHLEAMEARFEARFEAVDARFDGMESRMSDRFEMLEHRIDARIERGFRNQLVVLLGFNMTFFAAVVAILKL